MQSTPLASPSSSSSGSGPPARHAPRNRHIPRVCATCDRPMSGQGDTCWNCGALWTDPATAGGS